MVFCSKCDSENLDRYKYCIKCGANLTSQEKSMHPDWRDYVALKDEEYVVEDCNLPRPEQVVPPPTWGYPVYGFVLTNQRLIVLRINITERARVHGRITSFKLEKEFPLECVKDIAERKGRDHETIIYTDDGKYRCGMRSGIYFCRGLSALEYYNPFRARVRAFAYFRNKVVRQKGKKMVVLDFSSIRSLLEKGGIVLTTLRCPHCSAPIKMPKDGTEILCDHCENMIYAQDVFEKIQGTIS